MTIAEYGQLRFAQQGDAILPSDAVVVSPDSQLALRLNDGGRLVVDASTRIRVEGPDLDNASLKVLLLEGRLLAEPAAPSLDQGHILIQTPYAVVNASGAVATSSSVTDGDHYIRLAVAEGRGDRVYVLADGDTSPVALDQARDHLHIGADGTERSVPDRLAADDPRLELPRQLGLIHELDVQDPASDDGTGLETGAGGDLAAIGPIVVTRPVSPFDLSPEPAPLEQAALGALAADASVSADPRSHLADVLYGFQSFEDGALTEAATATIDNGSASTDIFLRDWDPGRIWMAFGQAIEPIGNVELDWGSFRQITSRDGPMAQLTAGSSSVQQLEQFLGLGGGRLDALDDSSTPVSGSAMRCVDAIHLEAGQSIWFDVFFDPPTDANPYSSRPVDDFAVVTISVGGRAVVAQFADAESAGRDGASGWQSLCYTAGVSGDYYFGFAVLNDSYDGGQSRLYVDSVRQVDASGYSYVARGGSTDEFGGSLQVLAAAPTAVADTFQGLADQPLSLDILANDLDPDPFNAIRLVGVDTAGTRGSVHVGSGQLPVYSANGKFDMLSAGQVATDTFRYVIDGGDGIYATGTVTIRVVGVNDVPTVRDDWSMAAEGGPTMLVAALANDDDIDLDDDASSLRIVSAQSANGATIVVSGIAGMGFYYHTGGAFDWLALGETTVDQVTYTVVDRYGTTSSGTVHITVSGSNDIPVAAGDVAFGNEDEPLLFNAVANDRDPDTSDVLRVALINGVPAASGSPITLQSGAVVTVADDGSLRYDPAGHFDYLGSGQVVTDGFTYTVSDSYGGTASASVSVTLAGRNDAPRPTIDAVLVDEDNRSLTLSVSTLLGNDIDPDFGDQLRVLNVYGAGVTFAGSTFFYDPGTRFQYLNVGEAATEHLGYTVVDASATSDGEILVTIEGRNDAPVAHLDFVGTVEERQQVAIDLLANDTDPDHGDSLHVIAVDNQSIVPGGTVVLASGAKVTLQLDGRITYDPTGAFTHLAFQEHASETFRYTIADRSGATTESTVSLVVSGVNDAPLAMDDVAAAIDQNGKAAVALLANDRDVDAGDWLQVVAIDGKKIAVGTPVTLASGASVALKANGILEYNPDGHFNHLSPGQSTVETVTYTVRDQLGAESTAVVHFTIVGHSDRPVAVGDGYGIDEDHVLAFDAANGVLANDYDPDTADDRRLFVSRVEGSTANVGNLVVLASGARLVLNADGSFTYDPRQAFDGLDPLAHPQDTFSYTVSDPDGHESTTTVTITVVGRNDLPTARPDVGVTDANTQVRLHIVDNDSDPEQASLRIITIDDAHKDFVRINGDGTVTYDPASRFDHLARGETATDTFYYTIDDGLGGRASSQVTVTIHGTDQSTHTGETIIESFEIADGSGLVGGWGRQGDTSGAAVRLFSGPVLGFEAYRPSHLDQAVRMLAQGSSGHGNSPIEQYLGLAVDALPADDGKHSHQRGDASDASAASAMKTTLQLGTEDLTPEGKVLISFDWNFLSAEQVAANQPGANDFAVFTVSSGAGGHSVVLVLSDSRETGLGASGWRTSTYDLTAVFRDDILAGRELTIGFAVLNDGDDLRPSSLLVDNVRLNPSLSDVDLIRSDGDGAFQTWRHRPEATDDQLAGTTNAASGVTLDPATLLANDQSSPGVDLLVLTGVDGAASRGHVTFDGSRITYDPVGAFAGLAQDESATDHFRYRVSDGNGGEADAWASVTVTGLNDAPQARLDHFSATEDMLGSVFDVLVNDDDVDSDDDASTLRIIDARSTSGAHVSFDGYGGGKIYYDASSLASYQALGAGETATDTITYTIADRWYGTPGHAASATTGTGQAIVTIQGINDLPVSLDDQAATNENSPIYLAALANDSDPDRTDRLQVVRVNGQALSFGNPVVLASGALVGLSLDGRLRYDPTDGFAHLGAGEKATDAFTYTASDGNGGLSDATISVIVTGLNDAPIANNDAVSVDEDHSLSFSATALLANDFDVDSGDSLHVVAVSGPGTTFDGTNVTYDPGLRFQHLGIGEHATERLLYTVADHAGAVTQAEVTMTIEGRNDAPVAVNDFGTVREDGGLLLSPLTNDVDADLIDQGHLHLAGIDSSRTVGVVTANPDGTVSYDPAGRFDYLNWRQVAYDQFDYLVSDEHGATSRATATVTVYGRNNLERIAESFEQPMSWLPPPNGDAERSTTLVQTAASYGELDGHHGSYVPTDGSQMAVLEARGTSSSNLESFLGLATGSLARDYADIDGSRPSTGSAIKVHINVQAGDEISFDWMFDARDRVTAPGDGNQDNDFALLTVTDASGIHSYKLSDVRQTGDGGASGWHTSIFTAQSAGTVTVGLASVNDRASEVGGLPGTENSVLLADNFRLNRDFDESYQLVRLETDGRLETLHHASLS
ncbi:MAG: Ig-like domain-containing protein [Rhodospirillales bacterium]